MDTDSTNLPPDGKQAVELITTAQRRRRWTAHQKMAMVEETYKPGESVKAGCSRV